MRLSLGSTSERRKDLKAKAKRLGLSIQIENYGKCSVYRFYREDNLLFSTVGLKEAFVWVTGFHSGYWTAQKREVLTSIELD